MAIQARERLLLSLWQRAHRFREIVPPTVCQHPPEAWHLLDANLAACTLCGMPHCCIDGGQCSTVTNEDGHGVCPITGCTVRCISFSACEYIDTSSTPLKKAIQKRRALPYRKKRPQAISHVPRAPGLTQHRAPEDVSRIEDLIVSFCMDILVGSRWHECMQQEAGKIIHKQKHCLFRVLKRYKKGQPGALPNVCDAASEMVHLTQGVRLSTLWLLEDDQAEERRLVVQWCSSAICKHIQVLNCLLPGVVCDPRLNNFCIGLLYLMRNGVVMHGIVVLPQCRLLVKYLPLENYLAPVFKVRNKCITETENIVKNVLRNASYERLRSCGIDTIDRNMASHR